MENSFVVIVLLFAALATGGLIVNWIGLGRAMSRLSVSPYMHQLSNRVLVYSEPSARMGPNARAMDSVSRHSNVILRSRVHPLSSCCDVKYQPSTIVMIDTFAESRRLNGQFRSRRCRASCAARTTIRRSLISFST
jgi:hypothetical protein